MNIYKLFPIENWEIFEKLCRDLWGNLLKDYKVKRFGRRGQKQKGLDITYKSTNHIIGIQCKCVKKLTTKDIDDELEKLKDLDFELDEYIIATTVSNDVKLDEHVLKISQESDFSFNLTIMFWEDIEDLLFKESNLSIIRDYYPTFTYDDSQMSKILNHGITQFKNGDYKSAENCLNTIKESLDRFSRENKYELCILEGKYLEVCRKYTESGQKYIEAYDYGLKDMESKYYKALGLCYGDNPEKAETICNEIIEEDPMNELAHSLLVWINKDKVDIPKELLASNRINYNKGLNAFLAKDYEKSYEYFKKSDCKSPIQLINCVNARFQLFLNEENFPLIISDEDYGKLSNIEKIFQKSIDNLSDTILIHYIDQLLRLLSINRLLSNYELLKENVERGLEIDENNKELLFYKAVLLEKEGEEKKALEILKEIPNVLDSFKLINLISMRNNDNNLIIEIGEKIIDNFDENSEEYAFCQESLIEAYIQTDRLNDAKTLIEFETNPFRHNRLKSKLCSEKSMKKKYLLKSYAHIENGFNIEKIQLALEFSDLGEYEYAINIYESTIDLKRFNHLTNDLAYCYFHNEDYDKLIELSEYFIKKGEPKPHLIEFEINAYLKINDFDESLRLINIYLEQIQSNYSMKIAKAKIHLFKKDYKEVDEFLDEKHDFQELSFTQCLEIYAIYKARTKNRKELLEMLLEIRNAHIHDKQIHIVYTQEYIDAKISFLNPLKVDYNTGVSLKYENIEQLVYVTKDNPDIRKFNQFEKILNHKKRDVITLETNVKIEILEIYDKFAFAFKESLEIVKLNSPEYIRVYHYESIEEHIDQMKEITLDKHSRETYLKKQYQKSFKPLILFSEDSGMDMHDSYFYLREDGLKSFPDTEFLIKIKPELVLDITSLFTIHLLNIEDKIAENYNLHISTSEYFVLKRIKDNVKTNLSVEMVVGYDRNNEFGVSKSNYKIKYKFVSKIIDWIDENCKMTKLKSLFELSKKEKENINKIPYPNIRENILLAYDDCTLVSDDLYIKQFIEKFFNVTTCGTLALIYDMFNNNKLTKSEFDNLILKLYKNNYKEVPITAEKLIKSIKEKDYSSYIKFIFDYSVEPQKYLNFDWDSIIISLDTQNINEKILFEMTMKLVSNMIFIDYCSPLLIKIEDFEDVKYIASRNSKIFHTSKCNFAKKINVKNMISFTDKQEAMNKGYKPCNKCIT